MIDDLDNRIAVALKAWPEPAGPQDLASRAIVHAQSTALIQRRLARLRRWSAFTSLLACLLMIGTLTAGYLLWPAASSSTSIADESSAADSSYLTDTSSSTSTSVMEPVVIATLAFLGVLVLATVTSQLSAPRREVLIRLEA